MLLRRKREPSSRGLPTARSRGLFGFFHSSLPLSFLFVFPVLAARRPSPRSITLTRQASLAGLLAPGRVGHRVVVVALGGLVRLAAPGLDGLPRRLGWDEAVAA